MKKFFLFAVLASTTVFASAQDIDEIRTLAYLGQTNSAQAAKAKEAIDKYLLVEKNAKKPDGWYWKAFILNMISKDSVKSVDESAALKSEAFETIKKYTQIDPKATLLKEENYSTLYDLYANFGSYLAIKAYQDKNFVASFNNFKKALEIHDYSVANDIAYNGGIKMPKLDTLFTQYAAIAANDAKLPDEAAKYHRMIVDAGIAGDGYADSYNFLVEYYKKNKDVAGFNEILAKAKKEYPKNDRYWTAVEIEMLTDGIAKPAVFSKYDELLAKNPTNYDIAYNYSAELFNFINSDESKNTNLAEYKAKLVDVLKKAVAINSTFEANFVMTISQYNNSFDLGDEAGKIKGTKPEDQKKKKALQAEAAQALTDAIPYGENAIKAFNGLAKATNTEKGNYRKLVTMMKNIYEVKKDAAKVAEYDKLVKEAP